MDQKIILIIDGVEVSVPPGTSILDAAQSASITIPTFCHHAKLVPVGACRICLVEIEKVRGLQPACSTPVQPEMIVHTTTPEVIKSRKAQLEFLLTNHPLDCPVCDAGGECDLQDQVFVFGEGKSRFAEAKRHKAKAHVLGPYTLMDQERCVMCRRCERFLKEWADDVQLGAIERGSKAYMDTFVGQSLDSLFSGNTIHVCPVGAITSRPSRFAARCWELKSTESICLRCALGCNILLQTKANQLKRIVSRTHYEINDDWLCDRGQFDHSFADPQARITSPMVRKDDQLQPATWDEALDAVVERFRLIVQEHGGQSVAALGSAIASNEANYLLQRVARACLHTNNIAFDTVPPARARLLPSNRLLDSPGVVVAVGIDLAAEAPLLELLGRHGGLQGCTTFVVVHPEKTHLAKFGDWLNCKPGGEAAILNGLAHLLIKQGKVKRVTNLENLTSWVSAFTPAAIEKSMAVSSEALMAAASRLGSAARSAVLYGSRLASDAQAMKAVTNLALILGAEGPAYIPSEANAVGAMDVGVTSGYLPGFQAYEDQRQVDRLIQLWGRSKLSTVAGMELDAIRSSAGEGALKAVYVLGRPPMGLEGVEFTVVQASSMEDVPEAADVVLPATSYAETEGTYTNLSGCVQLTAPAMWPLNESRPDWWILTQVGSRLGRATHWSFESAAEVFAEIAKVVPMYAGMSHGNLGPHGKVRKAETARLILSEAKTTL